MNNQIFEVSKIDGYVWCDKHGEIHEETTNPYDFAHHYENEEGEEVKSNLGRPVFLVYDDDGLIVEAEPECNSVDWKSLYCGGDGCYEAP